MSPELSEPNTKLLVRVMGLAFPSNYADLDRLLDAARAEGGALSHLVPELTRALRRISEVAASRASTGYNEAGRLAHIAAISDAALEYAEGWRCPWGCPSLMEHAADCPNLSQAEQAAGLCVEPSKDGWQPIETAPKDGSPCLILVDGVAAQARYAGPSDGSIYSGTPSRYNWFCETTQRTEPDEAVTHWASLPAALSPQPKDNENG